MVLVLSGKDHFIYDMAAPSVPYFICKDTSCTIPILTLLHVNLLEDWRYLPPDASTNHQYRGQIVYQFQKQKDMFDIKYSNDVVHAYDVGLERLMLMPLGSTSGGAAKH